MRTIEKLEETLMENLVRDINATNDPIEQYKAIERYKAFVEARGTRLQSESCLKPRQ